ncbi:DNA binding domain protein, excisionase family [Flavobacterium beibuense]|uniref:DNA binding domain protein, excisionase family n=1 Tax=Flavobacterium beibuense TaxID=657326 RepID=A0A444WEG5_9FLAO|nr:DNA binding domain protein, excisionase family [Flavobacterium beibuense]
MDKTLLLHQLTPEQLQDMIREAVKAELDDFKNRLADSEPDVLLTRTEASALLKVNITTLWNWTKAGKITAYGIGNRVYYKKQELLSSLVAFRHR